MNLTYTNLQYSLLLEEDGSFVWYCDLSYNFKDTTDKFFTYFTLSDIMNISSNIDISVKTSIQL